MRRIKLTKGKFALVDDEDFERVNALKWYASLESRGTKWYAVRHDKNGKMRMHRFVMGLPNGKIDPRVVDHLNHKSLDNRKCNLEITTQVINMSRSHGFKKKGLKYGCRRAKKPLLDFHK